jgi:predicted MFS family arabinose efflux permease
MNPITRPPTTQSPFADLKEGLRFIWHEKTVAGLMVVALTIALFGSNFSTLMPVVARDVLGKGEVEFGMLKTFNGLGSVLGTLLVTVISGRAARGKWLNWLNILFPLTLIGFAFSYTYPLALITLVAVGASHVPQLSMCNMLIQSHIPDEIRGRVMSVYSLTVFGVVPLGALIGGAMADQMGAPMAILLNAGAVIVVMVVLRLIVPAIGQLE